MKSSEIRQAFFDFFAKHGHQVVASSTLVPANDPTLLFTNAGMVPFKDVFLGLERRPYTRAVSAQRCVRAGGKHNDLENVGYTARHHTFFEMLGNFSFGDYFKREAIVYAWTFLTQVLHLPPERLWVTVYKDDQEAETIWLEDIGISKARFSRCGEKDNFWSMGDTGPCGPCTEIFYDHGEEIPGGPPGSSEEDGDRYIEIWNLVFMQYNRDKDGQLHPLPKPSVDTGMGLERIAAVVQGVHNNYHIDSFQHLIQVVLKISNIKDKDHPSLKVIADHIRACAFLINDGVVPGNEGRGYVLRRIIRRAVRHGHKIGIASPFLSNLLQPLIDVMGEAYPELATNRVAIERNLTQEENQFSHTLAQGLELLQQAIASLEDQEIPGAVVFKLYDTYGFPVDLTADIAREHGVAVDLAGFDACMQAQRALSQSASHFKADYSKTIKLPSQSTFKGYEQNSVDSNIMAMIVNGEQVNQLETGQSAGIVLQETPFYAESGGQVGDQGQLIADGVVFDVDDTQKVGDAILHNGVLRTGKLSVGDVVNAQINIARRDAVRLNHTATHLLHAALKKVLGEHVQQKGSLVDATRARFDFSHFEAITSTQLEAIEMLVNAQIRANDTVYTEIMSIDDAKGSGAVALFGEQYSDEVRVLSVGEFSKELCGGTHARRTGDIGLFKITGEYGVASGVRRIEMVTGEYALQWVNGRLSWLDEVALQLKCHHEKVLEKLMQQTRQLRLQEKEVQRLQGKLASAASNSLLSEVKVINDINLLVKRLESVDSQGLRTTLDQLKSSLDSAVIVLFTEKQGNMHVVAGISKNILNQVPKAPEFVRLLCGKGGGRDDMAQGGGSVPEDLQSRLDDIPKMIMRTR